MPETDGRRARGDYDIAFTVRGLNQDERVGHHVPVCFKHDAPAEFRVEDCTLAGYPGAFYACSAHFLTFLRHQRTYGRNT